MKKQPTHATHALINYALKFTVAILLIVVSNVHTQAQNIDAASSEPVASVSYLGTSGNNRVFQVKYDNATAEKFVVTIKDHDGVVLFQHAYADEKFDKRFKVGKTDQDKLTFVIRDVKTNRVLRTFEVNTSTRVIEEVVVQKQG